MARFAISPPTIAHGSEAPEGKGDRYRGAEEVADDDPYLQRPEVHCPDQQRVRHGRERGEEEADGEGGEERLE